MDYIAIKASLEKIGSSLTLFSQTQADQLKTDYNAPEDFISFLLNVGFGRIGAGALQIYDGFVYVDEIFGYSTAESENILLIGDDYQGNCIGYNPEDWSVVEVSSDMLVLKIAGSFSEYFLKVVNAVN